MSANDLLYFHTFYTLITLIDLSCSLSDSSILKVKFIKPQYLNILGVDRPMWTTSIEELKTDDDFVIRMTKMGIPILFRRYRQRHPRVELGPGVVKAAIQKYPPNILERKLKFLMKIQEEQKADLRKQFDEPPWEFFTVHLVR